MSDRQIRADLRDVAFAISELAGHFHAKGLEALTRRIAERIERELAEETSDECSLEKN
jgi:hypothetical protein